MTLELQPKCVELEKKPYCTITVFCPSDPIIANGRYSYYEIGNDIKDGGVVRVMRMIKDVLPRRRFQPLVAENIIGWNALNYPNEFTLRLLRMEAYCL